MLKNIAIVENKEICKKNILTLITFKSCVNKRYASFIKIILFVAFFLDTPVSQ